MLEVAPFAEPAPLLFEKYFALFGSKILPKLRVFEELLEPVGEFAAFLVGAEFVFEEVPAELDFEFGSDGEVIDFGVVGGGFGIVICGLVFLLDVPEVFPFGEGGGGVGERFHDFLNDRKRKYKIIFCS